MLGSFVAPRVMKLVGSVSTVVRAATSAPPRRERVDERLVGDPKRLSDLLERVVQAIEKLARVAPRPRIDFEDVACTSGTDVRLEHRFNGRVRWYLIDWAGSAGPNLRKDTTNTTANVLVLDCGQSGTATIRVEAI